jgi:hypothetical protein
VFYQAMLDVEAGELTHSDVKRWQNYTITSSAICSKTDGLKCH